MSISDKAFLELVGFLVTSARLLETEPRDYGQMRLMAAAARVCEMAAPEVSEDLGQILARFAREIPEHQPLRLKQPEAYLHFMDECSRDLARYLIERSTDDEQAEAQPGD